MLRTKILIVRHLLPLNDKIFLFFIIFLEESSAFVAFTAEGYDDARCEGDQKATMFNRTITNTGFHYNTENASFTVPYNGLYFLSITVHSEYESSFLNLQIRKDNGEMIGGAYAYEGRDMATNIFVVELKEGEVVWLICKGSGIMYHESGNQNTFSGFLLSLTT